MEGTLLNLGWADGLLRLNCPITNLSTITYVRYRTHIIAYLNSNEGFIDVHIEPDSLLRTRINWDFGGFI